MPARGGASPGVSAPTAQARNGRLGQGQGPLVEVQRARMLDAMVLAACERGAARVTVADVTHCAGVSRRTFYEIFEDSQDCLLGAIEQALARTGERVLPAYEAAASGGWRGQVRAGLLALLGYFDERPETARLLVVEWLGTGPRGLRRRRQVLERIARAIDEGDRGGRESGRSPLTAEAIVGAVASVLHGRLVRARTPGPLTDLVNPLMSMIVLPYLGAAAARRELAHPPHETPERRRCRIPEDPLKSLDMRLTYRTMRVIAAVAASPGGSNRAIAVAADVGDQGQISRLLTRLQRLGLLENGGHGGVARGEPNAWRLTAKGAQVHTLLDKSQRVNSSNTA